MHSHARSFAVAALIGVVASCGGRTPLSLLLTTEDAGTEPTDASTLPADGGLRFPDTGPRDGASSGLDSAMEAAPDDAARDVAPPPGTSCSDAPGLQPGSPWPIAGRCSARAGYTRAIGPTTTPTVKWQTTTDAGEWGPDLVVAADGTIYAYDGNVVALAPDGSIRWRAPLPGSGAGDAAYFAIGADGTLYATTIASKYNVPLADCVLSAFQPDGSLVWSLGIPSGALYGPAIGPDGTIYVVGTEWTEPNTQGTLTAVDPRGTMRWQIVLGIEEPYGPLAVGADGTVYDVVMTMTGGVLDAFTPQGAISWSVPVNSEVHGSPVVIGDDGTVYASCAAGICTFTSAGEALTTFELPQTAQIVLAPEVGLVYGADARNNVRAFEMNGGRAWTYPNENDGPLILTDGRGTAYLSNTSALSAADGGLLWRTDIAAPCVAMGADGILYCSGVALTALSL